MILPGSAIGILGGGQLGLFFAQAARRMGYSVAVWDPDPSAPARHCADRFVCEPFASESGLRSFLKETQAVTYEREAIPIVWVERIEAEIPVWPSSRVLRLLQNRILQKQALAKAGLPVAPFCPITDPMGLHAALEGVGFPAICKTATAGYDGLGQWRINNPTDATAWREAQRGHSPGSMLAAEWILEGWVPHTKELSVIVVRDATGETVTYPVTENLHENGILRMSRTPAPIHPNLADAVRRLAAAALSAIGGVGLFCVEMFCLSDDQLLINEIAPRPHNSGHYSLDAASPSQFEQQVRVVCNLPLITLTLSSTAVMINLLGEEVEITRSSDKLRRLLALPDVHLYLYGKREVRPGRKMGHLCVTGLNPEVVSEKAAEIMGLIRPA